MTEAAATPAFAARVMAVLWPSFLMAGVLEALVFATVDPQQVHSLTGAALDLSAQAVYTLAFFAFWAVIAAACAMTQRLNP